MQNEGKVNQVSGPLQPSPCWLSPPMCKASFSLVPTCLCPLCPLTLSWRSDHGRKERGQESQAGVRVHERANLSTAACEASLSLPFAICLPSESHPKHTCGPQSLQPEWRLPLFLGVSLPLESLFTFHRASREGNRPGSSWPQRQPHTALPESPPNSSSDLSCHKPLFLSPPMSLQQN